jgi:uracil-DNA glycosylase family 4
VGRPFVGAAGRSLDRLVARLGLLESEFAVVNVIKCRPPGNRFSQEAAAACRPFLAHQVEFLRPGMIVPLGVSALSAFRPDLLPITQSAGRLFAWRDRPFFPLIHPAAALHSGDFRRRWDADGVALAEAVARLGLASGTPVAGRPELTV